LFHSFTEYSLVPFIHGIFICSIHSCNIHSFHSPRVHIFVLCTQSEFLFLFFWRFMR
jgi:hypothetical protein